MDAAPRSQDGSHAPSARYGLPNSRTAGRPRRAQPLAEPSRRRALHKFAGEPVDAEPERVGESAPGVRREGDGIGQEWVDRLESDEAEAGARTCAPP